MRFGRRPHAIAAAVGAVLAAVVAVSPAASATPSAVTLRVETYNVDLGADLTPLFGATDVATLQAGAAKVYADVVASRPEERMRAVAAIIARQRADVVGLQEVALWQTAPYVMVGGLPFAAGPYQPTYDYLDLLLHDLATLGAPYETRAVNTNFDSGTALPIAVPISATTAARYTDRNVIITRQHSHLIASNSQQGNYTAKFTVTLLGVNVAVARGWTSIDVSERGRSFRVIDTHLEAYGLPPLKDQIRNPQAAELAGMVSHSPQPTMVLGDINARPTMCATWRQPPNPEDANTVAYGTLVGAGLAEVWPLVHRRDPCSPRSWTSGQDSLSGPVSTLSHRIDDVFVSTGFRALRTWVVGDSVAELSSPHRMWPSDHASTVAMVRLNASH